MKSIVIQRRFLRLNFKISPLEDNYSNLGLAYKNPVQMFCTIIIESLPDQESTPKVVRMDILTDLERGCDIWLGAISMDIGTGLLGHKRSLFFHRFRMREITISAGIFSNYLPGTILTISHVLTH